MDVRGTLSSMVITTIGLGVIYFEYLILNMLWECGFWFTGVIGAHITMGLVLILLLVGAVMTVLIGIELILLCLRDETM